MSSQYGMSFFRRGRYLEEQQRITKFAPRVFCKGPHIRNFESLCRLVFSPDHTNTDGSLNVEQISREDLTTRGFSIQRTKHTDRKTINDIEAKYRQKAPNRKLEYLLEFLGQDVRDIKDEKGHQAFVIVDHAPTPDLTGHAHILCAEKYGKSERSKVKELRAKLAKAINKRRELSELFPP